MNIPASFPPMPSPIDKPASARPLSPARPASEPASAPAAAEPAGEAALWDVLSPDERAFFEQQAALGPLTYGRPRTSSAPLAPTGQRLDVRG